MPDLSSTLLLIPCCASKNGVDMETLPTRTVADHLTPSAAVALAEGRRRAFDRTWIDQDSPTRQALAYYTGNPYAVGTFRQDLVSALRQGLHCLIVSGGYGLLRPEEPIRSYEAHMQQTRTVWRRLAHILHDYITQQKITRTFGAYSRGYAAVIPSRLTDEDWRRVPTFRRGVDSGSAMRVVPQRVGQAVIELIASDFVPDEPWRRM